MSNAVHPSRISRRFFLDFGPQDQTTIDIFEHRLHPAEGYTRNDMIMTLISMLYPGRPPAQNFGTQQTLKMASVQLRHPYGCYELGSVLFAKGREEDALEVSVQGEKIVFGDGQSFDIDDFAPLPYTPANQDLKHNDMNELRAWFRDDVLMSISLGALAELLPMPYVKHADISQALLCTAICARAARLVINRGGKVGQQASETAWENTSALTALLSDRWIIMPDQGWNPSTFIEGPEFGDVRALADPDLYTAGTKIIRDILPIAQASATPMTMTRQAYCTGSDPDLSNYNKLLLRQIINEIDTAIERYIPEAYLRPAAAKRAAKAKISATLDFEAMV
jgi:hypothetical protein